MSAAGRLQSVLEKAGGDPDLAGVVVRIEARDHSLAWTGSVGELDPTTPFFIASTTKLYTTAIVLRLADRGGLSLDGRLVDLVDTGLVRGLSVFRGTDHTDQITVRHLLAHTSGLPDYFMGKRPDGNTLEHTVRSGADLGWTLEEVLARHEKSVRCFHRDKRARPFTPTPISSCSAGSSKTRPASPMTMPCIGKSWSRCDWSGPGSTRIRPTPGQFRSVTGGDRLYIPKAMASFGPDGGVVATVDDLMRLLRGFFEGDLFDPADSSHAEGVQADLLPAPIRSRVRQIQASPDLFPIGPPSPS